LPSVYRPRYVLSMVLRLDSSGVWWGATFVFDENRIDLDPNDSQALFEVLAEMGQWGKDLIDALNDTEMVGEDVSHRESSPSSIEDVGVLIGALEILRRRSDSGLSPNLRRLHYALRDYRLR
jgi:hypothetical protein